MAKFVMVVQSQAKPGREEEYHRWYDREHLPDILAIPGVVAGRRFDATPVMIGEPGLACLAIFEIEADDPAEVMAEMGRRASAGAMSVTDSLDAAATRLWFYREHEAVG